MPDLISHILLFDAERIQMRANYARFYLEAHSLSYFRYVYRWPQFTVVT
jgi:hypothetical protein